MCQTGLSTGPPLLTRKALQKEAAAPKVLLEAFAVPNTGPAAIRSALTQLQAHLGEAQTAAFWAASRLLQLVARACPRAKPASIAQAWLHWLACPVLPLSFSHAFSNKLRWL